MEPTLFPMFVRLEGRRCLVVGAGSIAESKIESLLASGAVVRVVAPSATQEIERWARAGRIEWQRRPFAPSDLEGMLLVVSAASSPRVHDTVWHEAKARGVLCNVVDDPERCDFFYPAVVRRGALQLAISTGAKSPALAQRLRQELELQFSAEYAEWLERLGRLRTWLQKRPMDPNRRRDLLHRFASRERFERFLRRRR